MKLQLNADGFNSKQNVIIEHKDQKLIWDVSAFDKSNFSGDFDMFHYNNKYLEKKSAEEQTQIFNIFKQIRLVIDESNDWKKLSNSLAFLIKELFDHHDLQHIETWILFQTDIQFPPDLATEYLPSNDRTGSREQTYLTSDYQRLIALTLCLRLMIPIWGEFISRTRHDTGTSFKEYFAFLLLNQTKHYSSEAMHKLTTYVQCSIPDERPNATILGGISSEDFPIWILSLVVIRRLCTNDIRGHLPNSSLIPYIYNHVRERVRRCEAQFDGMVKDKKVTESSEEGRTSNLEGYKIRQEIPAGDVVLIEKAMSDIYTATKKICPDIDMSLLENAINSSSVLLGKKIQPPQITLVQWVFKPYISTRGILLIPKKLLVQAMGATQAILWQRGHHVLSALSTASVSEFDNEDVSPIESRARITKDLVAELDKYFPYTQRVSNRQKNAKPTKLVIESIDSICEEFSSYNWLITMDRYFLQFLTGSEANRAMPVPHDIRIKVAQLILDLAKQPKSIGN